MWNAFRVVAINKVINSNEVMFSEHGLVALIFTSYSIYINKVDVKTRLSYYYSLRATKHYNKLSYMTKTIDLITVNVVGKIVLASLLIRLPVESLLSTDDPLWSSKILSTPLFP